MRITFSGDNHMFYLATDIQSKLVKNMMRDIKKEKPDVMCYLGDFGEVLMHEDMSLVDKLFAIQPTIYVLGNHDLYNQQDLNPILAMKETLKKLKYGIPLQTHWSDTTTIYEKGDYLFLGVIGFPDFTHPKLPFPLEYYNNRYPTIDRTYINLRKGWFVYTDMMLKAFRKKLLLINNNKCSNVIILTHYSIFESQYRLNPNDDINAYFYCHTIGEMIKHSAKINPHKKFYCLSGHGHEYNINRWFDITNNIKTFGFKTSYIEENYELLEI